MNDSNFVVFLQPCSAVPVWGAEQFWCGAAETFPAVCHREPQTSCRRCATVSIIVVWCDFCGHNSRGSAFREMTRPLSLFPFRIPEFEPSPHHRSEDVRVDGEPRRLPPVGDDVCELPETAGLLQHRDHARETVDCCSRGPAVFPSVLISPPAPSLKMAFNQLTAEPHKSWLLPLELLFLFHFPLFLFFFLNTHIEAKYVQPTCLKKSSLQKLNNRT